jgi:hypothetical protein
MPRYCRGLHGVSVCVCARFWRYLVTRYASLLCLLIILHKIYTQVLLPGWWFSGRGQRGWNKRYVILS